MATIKYIYIHTKKNTDEVFYVGQGIKKRFLSKKRRNSYWKNVVNKYGFDSTIIEDNLTQDEANELEKFWIAQFKSWNFKLTNLTDGGEGTIGYKHSKESIEKNRLRNLGKRSSVKTEFKKGNIPWNKGKNHSEITKLKISSSNSGKKNRLGKTRFDLKKMEQMVIEGISQNKIAKMFNTDQGTISRYIKKFNFK